ncbi:MAG TPA: ATP-binding protein [Microbacterium sp.]|uniref:sensor histidine kinase n=1 Tax=Microbacterium sp. TaxID=51671 RepID=UPI002C35D085|nr:ATP-binding protein [Microbacterium sp.]HWI32053.1 ATP-binding protein [Microbacterium sp.]
MADRALWLGVAREDRTRGRSSALNQLLLGSVVLIATLLVVVTGQPNDSALLLAGVVLVFAITGAALIVPWNGLAPLWSAALPVADIAAIMILRDASPTSGFALLWVFPATWLAGSFGLAGLIFGGVSISVVFWATIFLDSGQAFTPVAFLVPLTIIAVATTAYLQSRRTGAQRALLDKQARLLARTVERAREQEDIVTEVLDAVDFGVIRVAADGRLTVTNEAHARLQQTAIPRGRALENTHRAVYAADGLTPLVPSEEPLARARSGEEFESELVWYGTPGESRRALSVTSRRLRDPDGSEVGGIIVSRDVTAEVTALRAREDLVASVSHELRTPLTSILGYLELVLDGDDLSPSSRRQLEVAERNATRLLAIVADILAASADARGGVELSVRTAPESLDAVVRASIEASEPRAVARNMAIDSSGIEPTTAFIDAGRIRQVLDNLLSNAVKYGRDGGTVEVGVTSDVDHAWVVVRDDGPGIALDEMPRLFERFFRSDAVRNTSTHGSGLGLAISRDIVRSHGGEITVRSVLGEGSTFVVRLPLRAPRREP